MAVRAARAGVLVDEDVGLDPSAEEGGDDAAEGVVPVHAGKVADQDLVAGGAQPCLRGEVGVGNVSGGAQPRRDR